MIFQTEDGLVHEVRFDEDRGSYGESICGIEFSWLEISNFEPKPHNIQRVFRTDQDRPLTCITCVARPFKEPQRRWR